MRSSAAASGTTPEHTTARGGVRSAHGEPAGATVCRRPMHRKERSSRPSADRTLGQRAARGSLRRHEWQGCSRLGAGCGAPPPGRSRPARPRRRRARTAVTSSPRSPPDRRAALLCAIDAERTARGLPAVRRERAAHARGAGPRRRHGRAALLRARHARRLDARRPRQRHRLHRGPPRLGARRGDRLGPAAARHARQPDARLAGQPRPPRDHPRPPLPRRRDRRHARADRRPANPGATAVLDFGFRTASPTLPRWRSATSCARTASTSRQRPARCASTSTRSKRSTQAILRSSTPSATTWRVQLPTSPTTS